jgi:hypothetical protein
MGVPRNTVAGQAGGAIGTRWRPTVAGLSLVVAAGLAVGGCGSSSNSSSSAGQRMFIVAYRLGARGKLPSSAGSWRTAGDRDE